MQTYGFIALRFRPDIMTEDFITIGVIVYDPVAGKAYSKFSSDTNRIAGAFPSVDLESYRLAIEQVRASIPAESKPHLMFKTVEDYAQSRLVVDDSALQWGTAGGGVSPDLSKTLDRLFDRYTRG